MTDRGAQLERIESKIDALAWMAGALLPCSTSPQRPAPYGYSIRTAGKASALG